MTDNRKTAVVVGGASGIGKRLVERLLEDDWSVWSLDLSQTGLAQQAASLASREGYRNGLCDVTSEASVIAAFELIGRETADVDALVCSAGVTITGALEEISPSQVDALLNVNVKGPWLCARAALPLLRKGASSSDPARVVIIGSIGGLRPKVGNGMYSASKAAIHVVAQVMAVELAASGVTVNVVAPGPTRTPMQEAALTTATASSGFKVSGPSPLGRIAEPNDVAEAVMFLLSDGARYVNGVVLPVDGGERAAFVKR